MAMEIWDLYDGQFHKTGRTTLRGTPLHDGEYHLAVHVWIKNSSGSFFIQKRALFKTFPGMWAVTGGSAVAGEDGLACCLREAKEELGVALDPARGTLFNRVTRRHSFWEIWLFEQDFEITRLRLQPEEVSDAAWVTLDAIRDAVDDGSFVYYPYMDELFIRFEEGKESRAHAAGGKQP